MTSVPQKTSLSEWEKLFATRKQQGCILRLYKEFIQINTLYFNKKFEKKDRTKI